MGQYIKFSDGVVRLRRPIGLAGAALALMMSGQAGAAGIINEDSKPHSVVVTEGSFRSELTLAPGEAATDVCAQCRFAVEKLGEIEARDNDLVVITVDGTLEKRS